MDEPPNHLGKGSSGDRMRAAGHTVHTPDLHTPDLYDGRTFAAIDGDSRSPPLKPIASGMSQDQEPFDPKTVDIAAFEQSARCCALRSGRC